MSADRAGAAARGRLFERLKAASADDWRAYVEHEFVRALADGTLPEACFRHYLGQDYLFLIHFARAYALAAFKAETLADMRAAAATVDALLNNEMALHVKYCRGFGMAEDEMAALPEANATMAYTRYVVDKGLAGDVLDVHVALAPCVVGYAEIGARLEANPATRIEGNPYREWIEMYAGSEYQGVAEAAIVQLDRLAAARETPERFPTLAVTFRQATRLEAAFWQMGLDLSN